MPRRDGNSDRGRPQNCCRDPDRAMNVRERERVKSPRREEEEKVEEEKEKREKRE